MANNEGLIRAVGESREARTEGLAPSHDYVWELFCELRKELIESQKTRAQVVGFKITVLGTGVAIILLLVTVSQRNSS